ncbi:MAG: hypothetical protein ACE5GL_00645 [Calditrichia bacterium]
MKLFHFIFFAILILPLYSIAQNQEAELSWPREIETKKAVITLYQPQIDSFKDDTLEGRMAVSIKPPEKEMIFGAVWFKARMSTDLDERTVALMSIEIPRVHFPDMEDQAMVDKFTDFLIKKVQSWNVVMSLDRLLASLSDVEDPNKMSVQINNNPPDIYFRKSPAILLSIDGDPILKKIENSNLEYVVNTPFFIVKEKKKKEYYVKGGKFWYVSKDILKGWKETKKVPSDIEKFANENISEEETDSVSATYTEAPELIVVTKPSELIMTDGEPEYATIEGTSLLYVKNSESDIVMDINTQEHYVLLAGRWYHSKSLADGDWKFSEPKELPEDFSKIPEESEMASVRSSIPGTPEAQDALLEQSIPQTATVDRKTASVEVTYDGNPEFKKVEGTDVAYAVNTDKTVLRINNKYYCVDDAIWFVSDKATGPWEVSDVRPDEVDKIPPESEVYNVKYVHIYDSTPEVVYVGYLPGYTYSYVYGGVVVYGTGYYYHPWYRTYYYPRPVTWGFGVHWNPYTGWGFSFGFSYGWVGWHFHPYRGWWGPAGYRYGYRHGYARGYHYGYHRGARAGYRAGYRAGQRNASRNVYRNRSKGIRQTGNIKRRQTPTTRNLNRKAKPSKKANNMYVDKKGNVHQRNKDGSWQQKSNKKASQNRKKTPSTSQKKNYAKPKSSGNVSKQKSQQQLNKSYQNRSRGNQKYKQSRSRTAGGRQGKSGGGRRR